MTTYTKMNKWEREEEDTLLCLCTIDLPSVHPLFLSLFVVPPSSSWQVHGKLKKKSKNLALIDLKSLILKIMKNSHELWKIFGKIFFFSKF